MEPLNNISSLPVSSHVYEWAKWVKQSDKRFVCLGLGLYEIICPTNISCMQAKAIERVTVTKLSNWLVRKSYSKIDVTSL